MSKEEYLELVDSLNKYSHSYHVLNVSLISDTEYDALYKQLLEIEKSNPEWIVETSPTRRVGERVMSSLNKNRHLQKMYSLDNIFSPEDMRRWLFDLVTKLKGSKYSFIVTPKLDGLSLNLLYRGGKLVQATTRGDGVEGEDVLKNVQYVNGIPDTIPYEGMIEIRGEVLMSKENFLKLNKKQLEENNPTFKSTRNAAAGSLRQLDPLVTKDRCLDFIAWGLGKAPNNPFKTLSEFLTYFSKLDNTIPMNYFELKVETHEERVLEDIVKKFISQFESYRDSGEYDIDGIVFGVDDFKICDELGYTIRAPRFSIAYKFQAKEYITRILDVTWQVGRTGVLTPVGEIEPIVIDGVTVSRCTLHNLEDIQRKNIGKNCKVVIIRSGDVIPKILRSIDEEGVKREEILPPTQCPSCGGDLEVTSNRVICNNPECIDRKIAIITHFASRDCLNIQGLGEEVVKDLVLNKIISLPNDVFRLTKLDLECLPGYQDKKINNLLCSINLVKGCEAWKFLNSLGLPGIGKGSSQLLTKLYGLDFLTGKMKLGDVSITGFTSITLENLDTVIMERHANILDLLNCVNPNVQKSAINHKEGISGKTFVITGTLSKPRETYKEMIVNAGGRVTTSVSKTTDFILCGENPGTKKMEAEKLQIPMLTENALVEMLK